MVYADYAFYKKTYGGIALSEEDFARFAARASAFLDYYTRGRAEHNAGLVPLKLACCAVAECERNIEKAQMAAQSGLDIAAELSTELKSETVGSWSQSYQSGTEKAMAAAEAIDAAKTDRVKAAYAYLAHTGILYRGGGCQ